MEGMLYSWLQSITFLHYKRVSRFIPKEAFLSRKSYFNDSEEGYFKQTRPTLNILQDPSAMLNMQMGKMVQIIPMMLIGGWMSFVFSGFLLTKVATQYNLCILLLVPN